MTTEAGRTGSNTPNIYFPLDQGERAAHLNVNQLLPRDVYERLAEMIKSSITSTSSREDKERLFLETRGHRAVFVDGGRGTGKTTVAVNLPAYLKSAEAIQKYGELAKDVHVLKPIDPTQLEDSDDLFLNVIVAAVLSDEDVKRALEQAPGKRQQLHECLQRLGEALQGRETQKESLGLDRLRSFMGSQALAFAVHEFFDAALSLLGKRLLAMPIDDVDMSLHKTFDYLEVVRRYLSSVAVLPIVCGDFALYLDVTERDAYRRLTQSNERDDQRALAVTAPLAVEYLRKVLPVQRRIQMPDIDTILSDARILIRVPGGQDASARIPMPAFWTWLRAILAGPVNGHENSELNVPVPTVRALSQLAGSIHKEFAQLEQILFDGAAPRPSTELMLRLWRTSGGKSDIFPSSSSGFSSPRERKALEPDASFTTQWGKALLEHFRFVPNAGPVCLVLLAARHWQENKKASVFATPLFTPLSADDTPELRYIDRSAKVHWSDALRERVPDSWLAELPTRLILPFATPEIGRAVRIADTGPEPRAAVSYGDDLRLIFGLVIHRNFYSQGQQATLLVTGRILELIATSLVRDVSADDIQRILVDPPFHSVSAVAKTKAMLLAASDEAEVGEDDTGPVSLVGIFDDEMQELVGRLNAWRAAEGVSTLFLSPWLIYCAINKTLNQASMFNKARTIRQQPAQSSWHDAVDLGLAAFNAFWASIASFEKGPAFSQSVALSNINLKIGADFEKNNLFLQNIAPLLSPSVSAGHPEHVLLMTRLLANHPLRLILTGAVGNHSKIIALTGPGVDGQRKESPPIGARAELLASLGLGSDVQQLRESSILKALRKRAPGSRKALLLALNLHRKFASVPGIERELRTLQRAIETLRRPEK